MCSLKEKIASFIHTELLDGDDSIDVLKEDNLLIANVIDSLGIMRLVSYLQDELGYQVPPEDVTIDHFQNLDALERYLSDRN